MSCHDIGRGLNSVVALVIQMMDNKEISKDAAKKIIYKARKGVYWCDGNEYEATACINTCRCGRCLKKMKNGEELYSLFDISLGHNDTNKLFKSIDEQIVTDHLCVDCFDATINAYMNDDSAGERERKFIQNNAVKESDWHAEVSEE